MRVWFLTYPAGVIKCRFKRHTPKPHGWDIPVVEGGWLLKLTESTNKYAAIK